MPFKLFNMDIQIFCRGSLNISLPFADNLNYTEKYKTT